MYSQMLKSWHSIFEAFTWGSESIEVVAMLRLVGRRQGSSGKQNDDQAKRLSHRQTSGEAGGETSMETRQQRQAKRQSQQTSGETGRKEGKKEGQGREHIHDEDTR